MPERQHRRYSARTKARAVGIAVVEGVTRAEEETGIPKETIHYWTHDPTFAQLRTRARDEFLAEMWAGVQLGVRALIKGLDGDEAPLRDKSQAVDVLARNYQLMSGAATSRTETKELTDGLTDDEKDQLRLAIRAAVETSDVPA